MNHQTSVISGTIFEHTKLALTTWFLGMYLLTQPKNGTSILELKRQLGVGYNAAWRLKHKLLQVMKQRDALHQAEGVLQGGVRAVGAAPPRGEQSRRFQWLELLQRGWSKPAANTK